jgi:hypothetical protein
MLHSRSARFYLERRGLAATRRLPAARYVMGANPVHRYPLAPPYPAPETAAGENGDPVPDTGVTPPWPPPQG